MAYVAKRSEWCFVLFVIFHAMNEQSVHSSHIDIALNAPPQLGQYSIFKPQLYDRRQNREIQSTKENIEGGHIYDLTVTYDVDGKKNILDLQLIRDLFTDSYFEKYQHNGSYVVKKLKPKDAEICHYQGKIRGIEESWAAISTCSGLSGVIFDGQKLHFVEKGSNIKNGKENSNGSHFLYGHVDSIPNHTCGYLGSPEHTSEIKDFKKNQRNKREADIIRGPYNANGKSRYIEMVFVVDNEGYKQLGEDLSAVTLHYKNIANIVNALYAPLNIFIALVGLVIWTETDEINLSSNGDVTLTNFLHYRRQKLLKEHPNDNAQLFTRLEFDGGVVGKALKGPICTFEFSGGVNVEISNIDGLTARSVAHSLGHNIGMEHDTTECECPSERCIMSPTYSRGTVPTEWSSCSLDYLQLAFNHGMDYCMLNKPKSLFDSPVCGNGFVEAGEQCDCGLMENCNNPCCNSTTCMLYSNATCATGECCDLQTCTLKGASTLCRSSDQECDLPEYCTDQSEYCPDDVHKMDGMECGRGKAFCYQGSCRSHSDQCRLLWGPSGRNSDQCYKVNTKGSRYGNCGYDRLNSSFLKCTEENMDCGRLQCMHENDQLEFGMEAVSILGRSYINSNGSIFACHTAIVDLGLDVIDPGLVPNGAKCGHRKMCVNQQCVDIETLNITCPKNCSGNGVCNSRGHCHCNAGFAPPVCDYPNTSVNEDQENRQTNNSNVPGENAKKSLNEDLQYAMKEFKSDVEVALKKLLDKMEERLTASNSTLQNN